jgi:hypothetical protein
MTPEKDVDREAREADDALKSEVDRLKEELETTKERLALKEFLLDYLNNEEQVLTASAWIDRQLKKKESVLIGQLEAERKIMDCNIKAKEKEVEARFINQAKLLRDNEQLLIKKQQNKMESLSNAFEKTRLELEGEIERIRLQEEEIENKKIQLDLQRAELSKKTRARWSEVRDRVASAKKDFDIEKSQLVRRGSRLETEIEKLKLKNASLKARIKSLKATTVSERALKRAIKGFQKEISELKNHQLFGADFETLMNWLQLNRATQLSPFDDELITFGDGPFNIDWLDTQLLRLGFKTYLPDPKINRVSHVIVGQRGWEDGIEAVVKSRFDEGPYFLTQELFVAAYLLNEDPFTPGNEDLLASLSHGHPAIEHLKTMGFDLAPIEILSEELAELEAFANMIEEPLIDVVYSDWDFLPPGKWGIDQIVDHFEENRREIEANGRTVELNRIHEINSLGPTSVMIGKKGWLGYVTFSFAFTEKIVLECPVKGNAVYILSGKDWQRLARKTKAEVRRSRSFWKKVVHKNEWLERVKRHLLAK